MRLFLFFRRKTDLTEELQNHLNMAIADRVARGESPVDARRSALREFGNIPLIADVKRERWGWLRLELFMQDLRYAWRQPRQSPAFTLTAILTLALGIGANTAIFTLVHAVMLKSLPVTNPDELYSLGDFQTCCDTTSPQDNVS